MPAGPPNSHLDTPNSVPDVSNGNSTLQASNQQLHLANSSSSNLHLSGLCCISDSRHFDQSGRHPEFFCLDKYLTMPWEESAPVLLL